MDTEAIDAVLRSLVEYRWGWRADLPGIRFIGKPVAFPVVTSIPTSLRRCRIVWLAASPMCATNLSFRLFAWVQLAHGHRLVAT